MKSLPAGVALTAMMLLGVPVYAEDGKVVEAVGEAEIKNNDQVTAKKLATADALKKCIEQVVGISIKSDFSATQAETVKGNETKFTSDVSDKLVQQSEGFIQKYDVLDERVDKGTVMKVKVRALVFESKIRAEVKKLVELLAAAGNPKVMMVIQEVTYSTEGKKTVKKESLVGAYLEKELIARGFELKGKREAQAVADDSVEQYDKWLADVGGVGKMARDQGADVVIAGRVEIHDKGVETGDVAGLDSLKGQTKIEIQSVIRGLNAATDEIMSTKPVQMKSFGTDFERAVHRAFQGRGQNLVKQTFDQLLDDLKESFKKTADRGQAYEVKLEGIKSFKKEGKSFLKLLEGVSGVSSVKQKTFAGGALTVDLACKCTADELQNRIFAAAEKTDGLSGIDIKDVSGKKLAFKL